MNEERFILEVEIFLSLYKTTHPFYKDTNKKAEAWNVIAEVLGVGSSALKRKQNNEI